MLSYIFFFLAGVSKAFMDTLDFHFDRSVFKNLQKSFWEPKTSAGVRNNFLGIVRLDGWHMFGYCLIGFMSLSVCFYKPVLGYWDIILLPFAWMIGFEIFWGKILLKEN